MKYILIAFLLLMPFKTNADDMYTFEKPYDYAPIHHIDVTSNLPVFLTIYGEIRLKQIESERVFSNRQFEDRNPIFPISLFYEVSFSQFTSINIALKETASLISSGFKQYLSDQGLVGSSSGLVEELERESPSIGIRGKFIISPYVSIVVQGSYGKEASSGFSISGHSYDGGVDFSRNMDFKTQLHMGMLGLELKKPIGRLWTGGRFLVGYGSLGLDVNERVSFRDDYIYFDEDYFTSYSYSGESMVVDLSAVFGRRLGEFGFISVNLGYLFATIDKVRSDRNVSSSFGSPYIDYGEILTDYNNNVVKFEYSGAKMGVEIGLLF